MKLLEHSETQNCANYNDDLLNILGTLNTIEYTISHNRYTISELVCQRIKLKNFCTWLLLNGFTRGKFKYVCGFLVKKMF